jgi:P27 family predicted phage terminase small subunit
VEGNPGKRPLPAAAAAPLGGEACAGVPEPPEPLHGEALAEWNRVAPDLHRRGWLRPVETRMLSIYCGAWAEWCRAEAALSRALDDPTPKPSEVRAWQGIVRGAEARTLRAGREFGLTPASRARLPEAPAEVAAPSPASRFFE